MRPALIALLDYFFYYSFTASWYSNSSLSVPSAWLYFRVGVSHEPTEWLQRTNLYPSFLPKQSICLSNLHSPESTKISLHYSHLNSLIVVEWFLSKPDYLAALPSSCSLYERFSKWLHLWTRWPHCEADLDSIIFDNWRCFSANWLCPWRTCPLSLDPLLFAKWWFIGAQSLNCRLLFASFEKILLSLILAGPRPCFFCHLLRRRSPAAHWWTVWYQVINCHCRTIIIKFRWFIIYYDFQNSSSSHLGSLW